MGRRVERYDEAEDEGNEAGGEVGLGLANAAAEEAVGDHRGVVVGVGFSSSAVCVL